MTSTFISCNIKFVYALFILILTARNIQAAKHSFATKSDTRHFIGPIGAPFGFLKGGVYSLTVFNFDLTLDIPEKDRSPSDVQIDAYNAIQLVEVGFLLKRFSSESSFSKYYEQVMENPFICSFESHLSDGPINPNADDDQLEADDTFQVKYDEKENASKEVSKYGVFLSMNEPRQSWKPRTPSITHRFESADEGYYFLLFQICPREREKTFSIRSTFELDVVNKNYDSFGNASFLTSGEMPLPVMFLYFSVSYGMLFFLWAYNIRNIQLGKEPLWIPTRAEGPVSNLRPKVHAIHHLMTVLIGLKAVTTFFEAVRYHYIRINGHAEFWSVIYFIISFIKGTFMFTVILLIGSGWSLVKPYLNDREKKIIWAVLTLQVIDNIAVVVLSQRTEGERSYEDWRALLHLVDIICCCAVLIPIVWQVNSLQKSLGVEERNKSNENCIRSEKSITEIESHVPGSVEASRTLQKLKLFRSFYLLVVVYIYFTRIAVYLIATSFGYRQTWLRSFTTELVTVAFYAIVGFLFRPIEDNTYLEVDSTDSVDFEMEACSYSEK